MGRGKIRDLKLFLHSIIENKVKTTSLLVVLILRLRLEGQPHGQDDAFIHNLFENLCKVPRSFPSYRVKEAPQTGGIVLEDSRIIELYWQRSPDAVSETANKYGAYCFTIAENILHNAEDSEECVNDTWLHAWNVMPPQRPGVLRLFLARITRNLAFDRFRARNAEKRFGGEMTLVLDELAECLGGGAAEAEFEAEELRECIQRFVRALPERDGNVMARRYFFAEPVAGIARRYGLSENNVMVILSRTRGKLKAHLLKEGYL